MSASGVSHVGAVRTVNEDSYFVSERLCLVADGMGGHEAGEIASGLVAELFDGAVSGVDELELLDLEPLLTSINESIRTYGEKHETLGMGTTVVGVAVIANGDSHSAVVFNVGDSRCYRLLDGRLDQLTTDHSHVQELIDSGEITELEARSHPLRNVVTRALGADAQVRADYVVLDDLSCRLLLCSDGLSGEVPSDSIGSIMRADSDPHATAACLIDAALAGAARDNITAVVIDLHFPDQTAADVTLPNNVALDLGADITSPRAVKVPRLAQRHGAAGTTDGEQQSDE